MQPSGNTFALYRMQLADARTELNHALYSKLHSQNMLTHFQFMATTITMKFDGHLNWTIDQCGACVKDQETMLSVWHPVQQ